MFSFFYQANESDSLTVSSFDFKDEYEASTHLNAKEKEVESNGKTISSTRYMQFFFNKDSNYSERFENRIFPSMRMVIYFSGMKIIGIKQLEKMKFTKKSFFDLCTGDF